MDTFERELGELINKYSREVDSHTPDFILAAYIERCLENWAESIQARDKWYGERNAPPSSISQG